MARASLATINALNVSPTEAQWPVTCSRTVWLPSRDHTCPTNRTVSPSISLYTPIGSWQPYGCGDLVLLLVCSGRFVRPHIGVVRLNRLDIGVVGLCVCHRNGTARLGLPVLERRGTPSPRDRRTPDPGGSASRCQLSPRWWHRTGCLAFNWYFNLPRRVWRDVCSCSHGCYGTVAKGTCVSSPRYAVAKMYLELSRGVGQLGR
jgi:hypothetical protein